jgi:hypothetical protein
VKVANFKKNKKLNNQINIMKNLAKIFIISLLTLSMSSCNSAEEITPETNQTIAQNQTPTGLISIPNSINENLVASARRLTNALNAGNERDAQSAFADNAIFDSVGRIYNGSADIMGRFLTPEVIRANGRYTETAIAANASNPNVVRISYDFRTSSYSEKFYYEYTIENGRITKVLGRYL